MPFSKHYGDTEGPLGFPMTDKAAQAVAAILRELPQAKEYEYRKTVMPQAATELNPGQRSDVSWISTQAVDRANEVVLAQGMDDSQFAQNPIVTLCHAYQMPPVGKSLWRKRIRDGSTLGIKAKTLYPVQPASWPPSETWMPDKVFALVQAGLVSGKSIGFLPLKVRPANAVEMKQNGWPEGVLVIEKWLLLEYACCWLPENQEAIVEEVSKGLTLPAEVLSAWQGTASRECPDSSFRARCRARNDESDSEDSLPVTKRTIPFTPEEEIVKAVERRLARIDPAELWQAAMDRARGRV